MLPIHSILIEATVTLDIDSSDFGHSLAIRSSAKVVCITICWNRKTRRNTLLQQDLVARLNLLGLLCPQTAPGSSIREFGQRISLTAVISSGEVYLRRISQKCGPEDIGKEIGYSGKARSNRLTTCFITIPAEPTGQTRRRQSRRSSVRPPSPTTAPEELPIRMTAAM
jgi:hypothetical protein